MRDVLALIGDLFILPALLAAGGSFFGPLGGIKGADAHPEDEETTPQGGQGAGATPRPESAG